MNKLKIEDYTKAEIEEAIKFLEGESKLCREAYLHTFDDFYAQKYDKVQLQIEKLNKMKRDKNDNT